MPTISISELETGMVLSADATNMNGVVLLKQGTTIEEKHLGILKTWGISQVDVEGDDNQETIQEIINANPQLAAQAEALAEERFYHVDKKHPLFKALIDHWKIKYICKEAGQK